MKEMNAVTLDAQPLNVANACIAPISELSSDKVAEDIGNSIHTDIPYLHSSSEAAHDTVNDGILEESVAIESKLSKNQMKKKRKAEKWEEIKILKKMKKKELKLKNKLDKPELSAPTYSRPVETEEERKVRKCKDKELCLKKFLQLSSSKFAIVIDCAWESEHEERPLKSLTQQILFCYGMNRRSANPCTVYLSSLGSRMREQLSKNSYEEWIGFITTSDEYKSVVKDKELVYLSADSPNVLHELDNSCAYIIGGIVDRNKLKGVTYQKALTGNIKTARLPIKEFCRIPGGTSVLTVNHVFAILMKFSELGSWTDTFEAVLPQRKGTQLRPTSKEVVKVDTICNSEIDLDVEHNPDETSVALEDDVQDSSPAEERLPLP